MHYMNDNFQTVDEGFAELEKAVETRDKMSGALYWNILNDDAVSIDNKLIRLGADRQKVSEILGKDTHY